MSKSEATTAASDRPREPVSTKLGALPDPHKMWQSKNRVFQDYTHHETDKLDKMVDHYKALEQMDKQADQEVLQANHNQLILDEQRKENQKQVVKQELQEELAQQVMFKDAVKKHERQQSLAHQQKINDRFVNDHSLQLVHPQMKCVPEYVIRQIDQENKRQYAQEWKTQTHMKNANLKTQAERILEQDKINLENHISQVERLEAQRRHKSDNYKREAKAAWDQMVARKEAEKQVAKETHTLVSDVVFGQYKDRIMVPKTNVEPDSDAIFYRKQNLMKKQRQTAEKHALSHALHMSDQRPNQYLLADYEMAPEVPLASVVWGSNAATLYMPQTSYAQAFCDPEEKRKKQEKAIQAMKEGRLEEHLIDCAEARIPKPLGEDQNEQNEEQEADVQEEQEQNEEAREEAPQEGEEVNEKEQEEGEAVKSIFSHRTKQSHTTVQSKFSKNSRAMKQSRLGYVHGCMAVSPDPFQAETRSVAGSQVSFRQRKQERSLNKQALTKIQTFDQPLREQAKDCKSEAGSSAPPSTVIRTRINQTVHDNLRAQEQNHNYRSNLNQAQIIAQKEAINRFVNQVQVDVVDQKRTAELERTKNQAIDNKLNQEWVERKKEQFLVSAYQQTQAEQARQNKKAFIQQQKEIPDIAGNWGFPQRFQPSHDMMQAQKQKQQQFIKANLDFQRTLTEKRSQTLKQHEDDFHWQNEEWLRNNETTGQAFKRTGGNMGQFPLDEAGKKRDQTVRLKEVWQKTMAVNQARQKLHRKQEICVDHVNLDAATFDINNKLTNFAYENAAVSPNSTAQINNGFAPRNQVMSQAFIGNNGESSHRGQQNLLSATRGESQPHVGLTKALSKLDKATPSQQRTQSTAILTQMPNQPQLLSNTKRATDYEDDLKNSPVNTDRRSKSSVKERIFQAKKVSETVDQGIKKHNSIFESTLQKPNALVVNLSQKLNQMQVKSPHEMSASLPSRKGLKSDQKSAGKLGHSTLSQDPYLMHKLNNEILKEDQVRNEPFYAKMDRKRIVAEEFRHHRGKPSIQSPKNQKTTDEEKYPWEVREEIKQYEIKRMISKKVGR